MNSDTSIISIIITIVTLYLYCQHCGYVNKIKTISTKPKQDSLNKFYVLQKTNHYHNKINKTLPSFSIGTHSSSHSNGIVATAFKSNK